MSSTWGSNLPETEVREAPREAAAAGRDGVEALDDLDAKAGVARPTGRGRGAPGDPEHYVVIRRASDDSVVARWRVWADEEERAD